MKTTVKIIITCVLFHSVHLFSQNIDSLKRALQTVKHDSSKIKLYTELSDICEINDIYKYANAALILCEKNLKKSKQDKISLKFYWKYKAIALNNLGFLANSKNENKKSLDYYTQSLKISEAIDDKHGIGTSLINIGFVYDFQGDLKKALEYYEMSLKVRDKINDEKGVANCLNNIGALYKNLGDITKALEFYSKSLKIQEKINNKNGIAYVLNNLALIYSDQNDMQKALDYYKKSLELRKEINDKAGIAESLNNIGLIYSDEGQNDKALGYYQKSLEINESIFDRHGIAFSLNNLGAIYLKKGNTDMAMEYYLKSLKIKEEINDKEGIAHSLHNLTTLKLNLKQYKEALKYGKLYLEISEEMGYPDNIRSASKLLSLAYAKMDKYKDAYEMHLLYKQMTDSVNNETNKKAAIQQSVQYEYEKKAAADSVKSAEEKKVSQAKLFASEAKLKQEQTQRFALYGGLAILFVFAGFMYNRFKVTHKQKQIIELKEKETQHQNIIITQQKNLVEEKHKEITDSINYAERIQRSFLASESLLSENLNEYFVFFQPKDVVSGDFYWAKKLSNDRFVLVTADSTGHGVPGAIMSILNISCLEKSVEENKLTEPAEILNNTREKIIERLSKDGSEKGGKDGMDCILLSFDFDGKNIAYAAANNPVWIVRNHEMIELLPDKMPVGKHENDAVSFMQNSVAIQKNDMVYAFTDGFADQFGGPKGKKFKYRQLKDLLISISSLSMDEQKKRLAKALNDWKQDLEQVDDITLLGIRI